MWLTLKLAIVGFRVECVALFTNRFWLESLFEQCDALCQPHEIRLNHNCFTYAAFTLHKTDDFSKTLPFAKIFVTLLLCILYYLAQQSIVPDIMVTPTF